MWDWLFAGVLPEVSEQWNYAMITLVVRFIGVFVVMGIMQVALQASSRAVRAVEKRQAAKAGAVPAVSAPAPIEVDAPTKTESGLNDATLVAIGLALALESRRPATAPTAGAPGVWSTGWRMRQLPHTSGR